MERNPINKYQAYLENARSIFRRLLSEQDVSNPQYHRLSSQYENTMYNSSPPDGVDFWGALYFVRGEVIMIVGQSSKTSPLSLNKYADLFKPFQQNILNLPDPSERTHPEAVSGNIPMGIMGLRKNGTTYSIDCFFEKSIDVKAALSVYNGILEEILRVNELEFLLD